VSPEAMARCRGVTHSYRSGSGSVGVLHGVDADFPAGAISAVVGPSGSGKSTLLRLLAGIDVADAGEIRVGGTDLTLLGAGALRRYRRRAVTYLAQRAAANLVPHLTLAEQVGDKGEALARALGLTARLRARASELSGGEQARAALAVGLTRGTPFVLIDEPTAELDRENATAVVAALRAAAAEGTSIVVATHDRELVQLASTRVELAAGARHELARRQKASRPSTVEAVIELTDVTKRYGTRAVVDHVSLRLRPGELGVVLGRSGSGKSTLLMVAAGWLAADEGRVRVPGGAVPSWTDTAYLAQRFGLLPELSVGENVALPLRLAHRDEHRALALLEQLDLADHATRLPAESSMGQQQRTALARALVAGSGAILADEPTSHQDAAAADRVWTSLAAACDAGSACLVATHDESAAAWADRLWRIDDGLLIPL
jgi:putative ABC transport system ATP-binding protein